MSATEDKTKEVAPNGEDQGSNPAAEDNMASDDGKKENPGIILLFFIIGFTASVLAGWIVFPKLLYSQKSQPFDFNHQLHNEMVSGCEDCHYFREDGTYAGLPELWQCRDCHEDVQGDTEDERIFVEEYVWNDREVDWLVYSRQPDCVYFSHAAHVVKGQMDCKTCHGDIGNSTSLKPYEENRLTGYSRDIWGKNLLGIKKNTWDRMKMDDCAECHVKNNIRQSSVQTQKGACFVCHK